MTHGGKRLRELFDAPMQGRPAVTLVNICHNHRISCSDNNVYSPQIASLFTAKNAAIKKGNRRTSKLPQM